MNTLCIIEHNLSLTWQKNGRMWLRELNDRCIYYALQTVVTCRTKKNQKLHPRVAIE
jgi:hypothetical protein